MLSRYEQASRVAIDRALELLQSDPGTSRTYKTDRDYATETDYAIEDALRSLLEELTPEVGFLGEERGHTGNRDTYWCLDPIDGTTNYSRGLPNYGISLALVKEADPVVGEIVLPGHHERYTTRGDSAYLGDFRLTVADTSTMHEALVSLGDFATGTGSAEKNIERLSTIQRMANEVGRVRMNGSAATDLAWLAAGRIDAVLIHSNKTWDMAAGVAMACRSGAVVTHLDGAEYSIDGPDLLATVPRIHSALLGVLNPPPRP